MWVKLDEKHKNGLWLARNKYEKEPFKVMYRLVDEEEDVSVFTLTLLPSQHVQILLVYQNREKQK